MRRRTSRRPSWIPCAKVSTAGRQVSRSITSKDRRAKALDEALSPADGVAFNGFLVSVVAVLLAPRPGDRCEIEDLAAFSDEVAAGHRSERRPVNEVVVEESLRDIYGVPQLFRTLPVPPPVVSGAGAAIVRCLNNTDTEIAADVERILEAAVDLRQRPTRR